MGITIHYRGTMDDVGQVESLEDRVLDFVYSMGGRATIWRSFDDHDSSRVVRGLMIELEPGHDTFSLLISPEGDLTPLFQIEEAEKAPFGEPPYCFVKTQFGSLQGHIAIVHLLDAIHQQYCSNLKVTDEGEYYEKRDVHQLAQKMHFLRAAIRSLGEGLQEHGLSEEAAEDPNILATRIERIAALVHQKLLTEQENSSGIAESTSDDNWSEPTLEEEVHVMDTLERQNQLRCERMTRRIAECTAAGMSAKEAFELSMQEEGLPTPSPEQNETSEMEPIEKEYGHLAPYEPWLHRLPSHPFDTAREHSSVEQAQSLLIATFELANNDSEKSSFRNILTRACMDIMGGLVQATSLDLDDITSRALAMTQLKRALTGHAYARGAVFGLRAEEAITQEQSTELRAQLEAILVKIHKLAESAWSSNQ
jgi:hypothetical protein